MNKGEYAIRVVPTTGLSPLQLLIRHSSYVIMAHSAERGRRADPHFGHRCLQPREGAAAGCPGRPCVRQPRGVTAPGTPGLGEQLCPSAQQQRHRRAPLTARGQPPVRRRNRRPVRWWLGGPAARSRPGSRTGARGRRREKPPCGRRQVEPRPVREAAYAVRAPRARPADARHLRRPDRARACCRAGGRRPPWRTLSGALAHTTLAAPGPGSCSPRCGRCWWGQRSCGHVPPFLTPATTSVWGSWSKWACRAA